MASPPPESWEDLPHWDAVPGSVRHALTANYPNPMQLADEMTDGRGGELLIRIEPDCREMVFKIPSGTEIETLLRTWEYPDTLRLQSLDIAETHRGDGIGRRVLRGTMRAFRKLGVQEAVMEAEDVGGYVWARAGFIPDCVAEFEKLMDTMRRHLGRYDVPAPEIEAFMAQLDPETPETLWTAAADPHLGPRALIGAKWDAVFYPQSDSQMRHLEAYCAEIA